MFSNQTNKFENDLLLPASNISKKNTQEIVQSASNKDVSDSTRSLSTGLNLSNQSSTNHKPSFGGFALSTKNGGMETQRMEYINLASQWPPSIYQKYDQRILTFNTWPKSHPIHPGSIARGGFIYTGRGDKVYCPWCQISLVDWETFDIPMDEHRKHSPNCEFILMLYPKSII